MSGVKKHSVVGLLVVATLVAAAFLFPQLNRQSPAPAATMDLEETAAFAPDDANTARLESAKQSLEDALVSALQADCSKPIAGTTEQSHEDAQAQIDAINALLQEVADRLADSPSAEHAHVAALLEIESPRRLESLKKALALAPEDPFVLWSAVRLCSADQESLPCPFGEWQSRLLAVDMENSETWIRVAANHFAADETDKALVALRRASTSAETNTYWAEIIMMVERGLAAGSDMPFPERAGMAFGIAAIHLPHYRDYVDMCRINGSSNIEWAHACLAYGRLVENRGKTEMGVAIARAIQRMALENLHEIEAAAEVQARESSHRQAQLASTYSENTLVSRVVASTPSLFAAYLDAIRSEGELEAQRTIQTEVKRVLALRPELACAPE